MKTEIDPDALYWASFNQFEMRLPGQAVTDIGQSGGNDEAVAYWASRVATIRDADSFPNGPDADSVRAELREYGAWNDDELADDDANWQRIVWIAAHNIAEQETPDFPWSGRRATSSTR